MKTCAHEAEQLDQQEEPKFVEGSHHPEPTVGFDYSALDSPGGEIEDQVALRTAEALRILGNLIIRDDRGRVCNAREIGTKWACLYAAAGLLDDSTCRSLASDLGVQRTCVAKWRKILSDRLGMRRFGARCTEKPPPDGESDGGREEAVNQQSDRIYNSLPCPQESEVDQ